VFISVLFLLPTAFPISGTNFNYTPVAFLVVLGGTTIWWVVSANRWFKGPKVQGTAEGAVFSREEMGALLDLAAKGIRDLVQAQRDALERR